MAKEEIDAERQGRSDAARVEYNAYWESKFAEEDYEDDEDYLEEVKTYEEKTISIKVNKISG